VIEDYVLISPGVHTVGTGAVVVRDISETGTYVGVPARRVKDEKRCTANSTFL